MQPRESMEPQGYSPKLDKLEREEKHNFFHILPYDAVKKKSDAE